MKDDKKELYIEIYTGKGVDKKHKLNTSNIHIDKKEELLRLINT